MVVLVVLLGVVVALLGLLVAGQLRSHAEILRALHQLGLDLDPARADDAPLRRDATANTNGTSTRVRAADVPKRPSREAVDVVGATPDGAAVSTAVAGRDTLTL